MRLYYGSPNPISISGGDWKVESNTGDALMGYSVSSAGDVNDDGHADVLAGLPYYTYGEADGGQVRLFLGNGAAGRTFLPRQLRTLGNTPIATLGRSDWQTAFNLQLTSFSSFGRSKFKAEWEVKQFPTNFTGMGTEQSSGWVDMGVSGRTMQYTKMGLTANTSYHWRIRIKYNLIANPYSPPSSRWFHMPWNGWNELDLRTASSVSGNYRVFLPITMK